MSLALFKAASILYDDFPILSTSVQYMSRRRLSTGVCNFPRRKSAIDGKIRAVILFTLGVLVS